MELIWSLGGGNDCYETIHTTHTHKLFSFYVNYRYRKVFQIEAVGPGLGYIMYILRYVQQNVFSFKKKYEV